MSDKLKLHQKLNLVLALGYFVVAGLTYHFSTSLVLAQEMVSPGLTILTPHANPISGSVWSVSFQTESQGELLITPYDQTSIQDLVFVELLCDDKIIVPSLQTQNKIVVKNWQCDGVAVVRHKVINKASHTLQFEFQGLTQYAHNSSMTFEWNKRLGGTSNDYGRSITFDADNRMIIAVTMSGDSDVNGDGDSTDGGAESSTGYGSSDVLLAVFDSSGTLQWAKRLGGTGTDEGTYVTTNSSGDIFLSGSITGDSDLNGDGDSTDGGAESSTGYGNTDAFISVFNSSGTFQWAKRLGGTSGDDAWSISSSDSNYLAVSGNVTGDSDLNGDGDSTDGGAESSTGYGNTDAFISVFNSSGTFQWAKRLGGTDIDNGLAVKSDNNNGWLIGGYVVNGDSDLNGDGDRTDGGAESSTGFGNYDIFLTAFNASGTFQWAKRLGGTNNDILYSIDVDDDNNITIAGYVTGDSDLNGDGDRTDGGAESSTGFGSSDAYFAVYNSSGELQLAKRFGKTNIDQVRSVKRDQNDNFVLAGIVRSATDFNGDGDTTDGTTESGSGYGIVDDAFLAIFDSSGTYQYAKRFGGTSIDYGYAVGTNTDGQVVIIGTATGNADLNSDGDRTDGGAESSTGYGALDIFMVSFATDFSPPELSSLSPASGTSLTDTTPTITFSTDENATCRLSTTDESYDNMADDTVCSGAGTTSQSCTSPDLGSDGSKNLYISCTDSSGNQDSASSNTALTYTLDLTPPGSGVIAINNGSEKTNQRQVTLNITASDSLSSVTDMRVADGSDCSTATWATYTTSLAWTLPTTDGDKTVCIQFKDSLGNISTTYTDSINLDTTPVPLTETVQVTDASTGKQYSKKIEQKTLTNLEVLGGLDAFHPQFCFSRAYDSNGTESISHYSISVDDKPYITNISYHQPLIGDNGDTRSESDDTVIKENNEIILRYKNYNLIDKDQTICATGKGDAYFLPTGMHNWTVHVTDNAGNQSQIKNGKFLVNTNAGSQTSYYENNDPTKLIGPFFPLALTQIGNKANLSTYATTNPLVFHQSTVRPLTITQTTPTFSGIASVGSRIKLEIKQADSVITTLQTNTNPDSNFLIQSDKSLSPGFYFLNVWAEDDYDHLAVLREIPIEINLNQKLSTNNSSTSAVLGVSQENSDINNPDPTPTPTQTYLPVPDYNQNYDFSNINQKLIDLWQKTKFQAEEFLDTVKTKIY